MAPKKFTSFLGICKGGRKFFLEQPCKNLHARGVSPLLFQPNDFFFSVVYIIFYTNKRKKKKIIKRKIFDNRK